MYSTARFPQFRLNSLTLVPSHFVSGTCAVIVTDSGKNRSLVANLAAANAFTLDHVDKAESWQLVEKAKMVYIAGFFLTVCPPAIMKIAKHVAETDKTLVMNLSAPFLCQVFTE